MNLEILCCVQGGALVYLFSLWLGERRRSLETRRLLLRSLAAVPAPKNPPGAEGLRRDGERLYCDKCGGIWAASFFLPSFHRCGEPAACWCGAFTVRWVEGFRQQSANGGRARPAHAGALRDGAAMSYAIEEVEAKVDAIEQRTRAVSAALYKLRELQEEAKKRDDDFRKALAASDYKALSERAAAIYAAIYTGRGMDRPRVEEDKAAAAYFDAVYELEKVAGVSLPYLHNVR